MELLNETFSISAINPSGNVYDYVSRAHISNTNTDIILDYHSILLNLSPNITIDLKITEEEELGEEYTYVVDGMIYEIEESTKDDNKIIIFTASFGGLAMKVTTKNQIVGLNERMEIRVGIKL